MVKTQMTRESTTPCPGRKRRWSREKERNDEDLATTQHFFRNGEDIDEMTIDSGHSLVWKGVGDDTHQHPLFPIGSGSLCVRPSHLLPERRKDEDMAMTPTPFPPNGEGIDDRSINHSFSDKEEKMAKGEGKED